MPRTRDWLLALLVCSLCFVWRLGSVGLFDFNEGLYVQAAREMYLRGDWITGRCNGVPFYDKPPLALWLAAASFAAFGTTEFAARLPVALAAVLLGLLTFGFGWRAFGKTAAWISLAALAMSPMVLGTARQMTMDIHQSAWVAVAMCAYYAALHGRSKRAKWLYLVAWAACGLGFMAKSLPGFLPLVCVFVHIVATEGLSPRRIARRVWETMPVPGLVVLATVVLPWHIAAYRAHGAFFYHEYWSLHHVGLLKGTDFGHAQPAWYYVPALLAGMAPWSFLLPGAIAGFARKRTPAHVFVFVWASTTVVVLTCLTSKLVSYALPMYVPAALLIGDWVAGRLKEKGRGAIAVPITLAAGLAAAGAVLAFTRLGRAAGTTTDAEARNALSPELIAYAKTAAACLAGGLSAAAIAAWLRGPRAGIALLAGAMALFVGITWTVGLDAYERTLIGPLHRVTRAAARQFGPDTRLIVNIGRPRRPSVYFYMPDRAFTGVLLKLGQPIFLETWDIAEVAGSLGDGGPALVLGDGYREKELLAAAPQLRPVERDGRWVLYRQTGIGP